MSRIVALGENPTDDGAAGNQTIASRPRFSVPLHDVNALESIKLAANVEKPVIWSRITCDVLFEKSSVLHIRRKHNTRADELADLRYKIYDEYGNRI